VIFSKELFFSPSKNYLCIYTPLFETLKTRILKSIITWSEMGQQTARVKRSIKEISFEVLKLGLWKAPRLFTKIKSQFVFFGVCPWCCMFFVFFTDKAKLIVVVNSESWRFSDSASSVQNGVRTCLLSVACVESVVKVPVRIGISAFLPRANWSESKKIKVRERLLSRLS